MSLNQARMRQLKKREPIPGPPPAIARDGRAYGRHIQNVRQWPQLIEAANAVRHVCFVFAAGIVRLRCACQSLRRSAENIRFQAAPKQLAVAPKTGKVFTG